MLDVTKIKELIEGKLKAEIAHCCNIMLPENGGSSNIYQIVLRNALIHPNGENKGEGIRIRVTSIVVDGYLIALWMEDSNSVKLNGSNIRLDETPEKFKNFLTNIFKMATMSHHRHAISFAMWNKTDIEMIGTEQWKRKYQIH